MGDDPADQVGAHLVVVASLFEGYPARKFLRWHIWFAPEPQQRSPFDADQATERHYASAYTDPSNLKVAQHLAVHLGPINAAVLSRLGDGQPRGKRHRLIVGSEQSADHRKLPLAVLTGTLHDPLRSPVIDPRHLGGGVDRCAVTVCREHRDYRVDGLCRGPGCNQI